MENCNCHQPGYQRRNGRCEENVIVAPIDGRCGPANGTATSSAPTTNLCSAGSASSITTTTTNYTWTCNGSNGGRDDSCSAPRIRTNQSCTGLPLNASRNTTTSITQTWNTPLATWLPATTGVHNTTASITECRFICNTNSTRNGVNCVTTGLPPA
jgi:hypothetical protein